MAISRSCTPAKLLILALIALATPALGAAAPACVPHPVTRAARNWSEPLARTITLSAGDVSLKEALEKLADAARLRLSYSNELLPLQRRICATYTDVAAGDALLDMLRGVAVEPVAAGGDHIVLAPSSQVARIDDPAPTPVFPLSPLVATATAQDPEHHQPGYSFALIHRDEIARQGSVAAAINALVPGVWSWQSPSGFTSIMTTRGASSFGVTAPKLYIDGIEVANPLLAAQVMPDNIERIEIIRGPQGAALYGADALNGVTNIVTRHEAGDAGGPRVRVRSGLAVSQTDFPVGSAVGQDHAASVQLGSRARSANLSMGVGSVAEYMPGAFTRHLSGDGNARLVGDRAMLTATARVFAQSAGSPASLMLDTALYNITSLSMRQYTLGMRVLFQQNDRLTHSLVIGVDGYSFGNVEPDSTAPLSASDSVLRAWDNGLRTTLRFATVAELDVGDDARASLTFGLEHSGLHQHGTGASALEYGGGYGLSTQRPENQVSGHTGAYQTEGEYLAASALYDHARSSNGVTAQIDAAVHERLFVNGGFRVEHDFVNGGGEGTALLPMMALSYVIGGDNLSLKLRGAYGKGVRWPEMPRLENSYQHARILRPILAPEQQSGIEGGFDLAYRTLLGINVTRYHQTATGLSQMVALQPPQNAPASWSGFAVQAVGEIANRGWELQAFLRQGALSLTGGLAWTDSRVQRIANGYTGDLVEGDRMLGVPARTVSLDASWRAPFWSASLTAARAYDWINYDRAELALLADQPTGQVLRSYWQAYNGFTHLRATLSRNITREFTFLLIGDNLLDKQLGEPDNLTVVPGRTVSFGVKAAF